VLLALLVMVTWLIVWIIRWLFQVLSPRAALIAQWFLAWGSRHRRVNRVIGGLLDPAQPAPKALLAMGVLLIGSAWLFLGVLEDVVTGDPLVRADQSLYQLMQSLRTPWGDRVMVFVTELGDGVVIALVATAVLVWLSWRRHWRAAGYWIAAIGFGQLAATVLKLVLQRARPLADLYDGLSAYAFPSGHATMSMVAYGFLAVLVARNFSLPRRWIVYALAALLIGVIAVSRLYLGAHWLSDVLGGLSLGLAWVSLLAIAYFRHPATVHIPQGLPHVALLALILVGGWHVAAQYSTDLQRYAPRVIVQHRDSALWWQEDWRRLSAYRQDLEGEFEQPLNVQWAGTLASLHERLGARGWREPATLRATTALRWLLPIPNLAELPVLPHVHDGRHESLLMIRSLNESQARERATSDRQLVLRFWTTGIMLDPDEVPLWVGSVSLQEPRRILFLRPPVTTREYDMPLALLMRALDGVEQRVVRRSTGAAERESHWSGSVLLIRDE